VAFVALEGVDGAGKSTLASELAETLGAEVRHFGPLRQDPLKEYVLDVQNIPATPGVIFDRYHIGEDVYGPLYRGGSAMTRAQRRWIDLWGLSRGVTLFHVTQPLEVIERRLAARGEDFLKPEDVAHVLEAFERETKESPLYAGDVSPGTQAYEVGRLAMLAKYNETRANRIYERYPSFVGDPVPRVLLVGEKRGGTPPYEHTSCFLPTSTSSGSFLLGALHYLTWKTVAMVNGVEEGERLPDLLNELAFPPVVALGREASRELTKRGIDHAGVPHPQYVRRFFNSRQQDYGILIDEVTKTGRGEFSWPK
jgi:gluconate kinase